MNTGSSAVPIRGCLLGHLLDEDSGEPVLDVVHVIEQVSAEGPAENAFVFVERAAASARYVSWINYYDLDYAVAHEPRRWRIVEPSEPYAGEFHWRPFGWDGDLRAPTVGDYATLAGEI